MLKWLFILSSLGFGANTLEKARDLNQTLSRFNAKVTGTFSTKYLLLNGHLNGSSFVYAINPDGKIVWHYEAIRLPPSDDVRTRTIVVKPIDSQRLALLRPYERSFFEIIDWRGNLLQKVDPQKSAEPYVLHHDFILEGNSLLSFGNSVGTSRKWWKPFAPVSRFLGSPVIRVNLSQNVASTLWDYLKERDPFRESDWAFTDRDSGVFWASWGLPKVENNYVHLNSIDYQKGKGYLLSARSLNKLIFLDESLKKVLWTAGFSSGNDYRTKDLPSEFYRQHHATFLENGNILLFDNKGGNSRIIEVAKNDFRHTLDLKREFRPIPSASSPRHGSAFQLKSRNILGYFPNTSKIPGPDIVVEFDYVTGRELARMEIDLGTPGVGYRAIPIDDLGTQR